jgi:hypothetical protein
MQMRVNMNTQAIHRELWSIPAVSGYIGIALSLWSVIVDRLVYTAIVLTILSIILALYLFAVNRKCKVYKPYKKVDVDVHKLTYHVHDLVTKLRHAPEQEWKMQAAIATKSVLTDASNMFTTLTGYPCTASLMLPISPDNGNPVPERLLQTVQYCHNAKPERESQKSSGIAIGKGVPGRAFTSGDVITWRDSDSNFVSTRTEHRKYYASGMCCPIRSGLEFIGLVNIDCLAEDGFSDTLHRELGAAVANAIGFITMTLELRMISRSQSRNDVAANR